MDDPTERDLLDLAVVVAQEAAGLVQRGRRDGVGAVATKSSATDPVTATDRAVERLIVERLRAARPRDGVLGEEYGAEGGAPGRVRWVVDPIDGTVNFLYGLP